MSQSTRSRVRFGAPLPVPLEATFDAGRLTSDGGLPWLARADQALAVCAAVAACVPEWRRRAVRHSLEDLVRQRVYQIACGYADQNDADSLRQDPLLKLVCGRWPESGAALASQPTFSRLENAVDRRSCYRLALALGELYLRERERAGVPTHIVLELDGTDDPTHGQQDGSAYHGSYRQHLLHPLLIFDGTTGQLLTAVLRPGTTHGSTGVVAVLKQVVRRLRALARGHDRAAHGQRRRGAGHLCLVREGRDCLHHRPHHQSPPHRVGRPSRGRGAATARGDRR